MTNNALPSRTDIISVIDKLMAGEVTRAEVSAWAFRFISDEDLRIDDDCAWEVLQNLGGADLVSTDRPFLYASEDFREWRDSLR